MGIVSRVWDGDLMRDLATKTLRPELRSDPRMVSQFLWEARIGAYLDHPNIIPVHDLGTSDDGPYFTMKRARGRSLAEWLVDLGTGDKNATVRLTLMRRLRIHHQVCNAIAFAHRRGVLHRDLKPANVLLGDEGEVLVTDWGLAVPVPGSAGDELRRVMPKCVGELSAGTPLYMSPEQARGGALDERSDIYTLGVMLYELATLSRPFDREVAENTSAVRRATRPVREVWPGVPRSLEAVITRALQPDPEDRYTTAAEMADDLERVIDGHTPLAEKASAPVQLARYYMTRDRAMGRLRVVDIDLWAAASWMVGIGMAPVAVRLLGGWCWIAFVVAGIAAVVPTVRYWRARAEER